MIRDICGEMLQARDQFHCDFGVSPTHFLLGPEEYVTFLFVLRETYELTSETATMSYVGLPVVPKFSPGIDLGIPRDMPAAVWSRSTVGTLRRAGS
jgi:hypothetical protein